MTKDNIFVGLEIGTSKICVVVAQARHDGTLKVLGVGTVPARGVRKGEIVDFETAKRCVHDAIADAEEKSDVEISEVYLGITGGHIRSFNNRGVVVLDRVGGGGGCEWAEELEKDGKGAVGELGMRAGAIESRQVE